MCFLLIRVNGKSLIKSWNTISYISMLGNFHFFLFCYITLFTYGKYSNLVFDGSLKKNSKAGCLSEALSKVFWE